MNEFQHMFYWHRWDFPNSQKKVMKTEEGSFLQHICVLPFDQKPVNCAVAKLSKNEACFRFPHDPIVLQLG